MGCNCKSKRTLENAEKYSDDNKYIINYSFIQKAITAMFQLLFGIIVGAVFIVMAVPFFVYVTYCVAFNKEATFDIAKLKKIFGGNNK